MNGTVYEPMPEVRQDRALVIHPPAGQARRDLVAPLTAGEAA